jgi:hypothetical protein
VTGRVLALLSATALLLPACGSGDECHTLEAEGIEVLVCNPDDPETCYTSPPFAAERYCP